MSFKEPTFEEFKKATVFARLKYQYGLIISVISIICFIILIFYMIRYGKELASDPLIYGANKYDVVCDCFNYETGRNLYVNSTSLIFKQKQLQIPGG